MVREKCPRIVVFCGDCQIYHNEEDVEFIDIEEDILGHDVMTFRCPVCKKSQRSKRLGQALKDPSREVGKDARNNKHS